MDFALAPASYGILALIVAVSVLGLTSAPRIIERSLLRPFRVAKGQAVDTLITCGFVHADFNHLFFNALTLYFFGPTLELTIGTPRFIALYFIGLAISSLGTVVKHKANPDYSALGASGAILSVLFAYIVYYPKAMLGLFFVIPVPAVLYAFGFLAYTWWASKHSRGRINHDAHLDGALVGLLFVFVTDFGAWHRALQMVLH